jgi:hypothetical protein
MTLAGKDRKSLAAFALSPDETVDFLVPLPLDREAR